MADDLDALQDRYASFIAERDWEQFHTPQNVAQALSVEANELLECFLWQDNPPAATIKQDPELMTDIEEEIADVVIYSLSLAEQLDIDVLAVVEQKLKENETRFDAATAAEITSELEQWQRDNWSE